MSIEQHLPIRRTSGIPRTPRAFPWWTAFALLLCGLLVACTGLKLVPDYDAEAAKGITDTSAEVFAFYDRMLEAKVPGGAAKLPYAQFADDWGKIETHIRVLKVREDSRPLNAESQRIADILLAFWQKYRAAHQQAGDYSATLLRIHRDRFQRLFTAALVAEKAKALAREDTDTQQKEQP